MRAAAAAAEAGPDAELEELWEEMRTLLSENVDRGNACRESH